jgi:hypothetical protein
MKDHRRDDGDARAQAIGGLGGAWQKHGLGAAALALALATATCAGYDDGSTSLSDPAPEPEVASAEQSLLLSTPVGLSLEIENGQGVPISVRAGQKFYIDGIDLRAALTSAVDEGVAGLDSAGDAASLDWTGVALEEQGPMLDNGDGTFTRRRFYRGAAWMKAKSSFTVTPVSSAGVPLGLPITLSAGRDDQRLLDDAFFVRRFRAIQWTRDCPSADSCAGATAFEEEALVEARNATDPKPLFVLPPLTAALRVAWSLKPGATYSIPVTQVACPTYDYGFSIDVSALTPPGAGGFYAPGQDITFQITLRDGSGNRLHPQGSLPTYNEVIFGANEPGIQYYRAFFDATATFWRRKHREHMLMGHMMGPAQAIQPIRSVVPMEAFLGPDDVQSIGVLERDGVYAEFQTFPPANDLFGGAFDPTHAGWAAPVTDTMTFHLPDNAPAGTYLVTVKGRRKYMGESVPYTRTIQVQVGSAQATSPTLTTGSCSNCHTGGGSLSKVLHANENRATCAPCHAPLAFELEGPIAVRTHFLHSRSNRVGQAAVKQCSNCHANAASIQRTSKAACMSCHTSYPASHVADFGPVTHIYVGGGAESFEACTQACHTTHPDSGL